MSDSPAPIPLRRVVGAGTSGNVMACYDFAMYGYFAPVIGRVFSPTIR